MGGVSSGRDSPWLRWFAHVDQSMAHSRGSDPLLEPFPTTQATLYPAVPAMQPGGSSAQQGNCIPSHGDVQDDAQQVQQLYNIDRTCCQPSGQSPLLSAQQVPHHCSMDNLFGSGAHNHGYSTGVQRGCGFRNAQPTSSMSGLQAQCVTTGGQQSSSWTVQQPQGRLNSLQHCLAPAQPAAAQRAAHPGDGERGFRQQGSLTSLDSDAWRRLLSDIPDRLAEAGLDDLPAEVLDRAYLGQDATVARQSLNMQADEEFIQGIHLQEPISDFIPAGNCTQHGQGVLTVPMPPWLHGADEQPQAKPQPVFPRWELTAVQEHVATSAEACTQQTTVQSMVMAGSGAQSFAPACLVAGIAVATSGQSAPAQQGSHPNDGSWDRERWLHTTAPVAAVGECLSTPSRAPPQLPFVNQALLPQTASVTNRQPTEADAPQGEGMQLHYSSPCDIMYSSCVLPVLEGPTSGLFTSSTGDIPLAPARSAAFAFELGSPGIQGSAMPVSPAVCDGAVASPLLSPLVCDHQDHSCPVSPLVDEQRDGKAPLLGELPGQNSPLLPLIWTEGSPVLQQPGDLQVPAWHDSHISMHSRACDEAGHVLQQPLSAGSIRPSAAGGSGWEAASLPASEAALLGLAAGDRLAGVQLPGAWVRTEATERNAGKGAIQQHSSGAGLTTALPAPCGTDASVMGPQVQRLQGPPCSLPQLARTGVGLLPMQNPELVIPWLQSAFGPTGGAASSGVPHKQLHSPFKGYAALPNQPPVASRDCSGIAPMLVHPPRAAAAAAKTGALSTTAAEAWQGSIAVRAVCGNTARAQSTTQPTWGSTLCGAVSMPEPNQGISSLQAAVPYVQIGASSLICRYPWLHDGSYRPPQVYGKPSFTLVYSSPWPLFASVAVFVLTTAAAKAAGAPQSTMGLARWHSAAPGPSNHPGNPGGAVKLTRRKKKEVQAVTVEWLEQNGHFDKPIQVAANELQMGVTTLKKICRRAGIPRWPFRKRSSHDKQARKAQAQQKRKNASEVEVEPQSSQALSSPSSAET